MSEKAIRERDEQDPIGAFKRAREMDPEYQAQLDADLEHYKRNIAPPSRAANPRAELPGGCHRDPFDAPGESARFLLMEELTDFKPEAAPASLHGTAEQRKATPVYSGVLRYFPLALAAVAHCSKVGNDQHNPGEPLHWARGKSTDEGDALVRHLLEAGTRDTDGVRHTTKVAWRALALLQKEIENDGGRL